MNAHACILLRLPRNSSYNSSPDSSIVDFVQRLKRFFFLPFSGKALLQHNVCQRISELSTVYFAKKRGKQNPHVHIFVTLFPICWLNILCYSSFGCWRLVTHSKLTINRGPILFSSYSQHRTVGMGNLTSFFYSRCNNKYRNGYSLWLHTVSLCSQ